MLVLQVAYRDVVAIDSVVAMTIRLIAWVIILTLMFFQTQKNRTVTQTHSF